LLAINRNTVTSCLTTPSSRTTGYVWKFIALIPYLMITWHFLRTSLLFCSVELQSQNYQPYLEWKMTTDVGLNPQ